MEHMSNMKALFLALTLVVLFFCGIRAEADSTCCGIPKPSMECSDWKCGDCEWLPMSVKKKGTSCLASGGGVNATCNGDSFSPECVISQQHGGGGSQPTYVVSVSVSGLNPGNKLSLQNNGGAAVSIISNGIFPISQQSSGTTYDVSFSVPSTGQVCTLTNGIGTVAHANVSNIFVACTVGWAALSNPAQDANGASYQPSIAFLLSDGRVLMNGGDGEVSTAWYTLTPDASGHYVKGTWSTITPSHCPHAAFASQVLRDGRFFVAGGEYGAGGQYGNPGSGGKFRGTGCASTAGTGAGVDAEIYDPFLDQWTVIVPPLDLIDPTKSSACGGYQAFSDMISEILPDGSVLMAPIGPRHWGDTLIYSPKDDTWSFGGTLANGVCNESETSWVKLPDNSILVVDSQSTTSERYLPSPSGGAGEWHSEGPLPVALFDAYGREEGPPFLLPNGNAIFIGSNPVTALYVPTGTTDNQGNFTKWIAGPCVPSCPGTMGVPDGPGAMLVTGNLLIGMSDAPSTTSPKPSGDYFYEYDYRQGTLGSFAPVQSPGNAGPIVPLNNDTTDGTTMLNLPDGAVLFKPTNTPTLYVYQPAGPPLPQGQPIISRIDVKADGSFHLIGTGLNGISEGSAFGDDSQVASNYPLVRLTDPNGAVRYARTHDWSGTGVMTGGTLVSTEFTLPELIFHGTPGKYRLEVVANGNPSTPRVLCSPVWVNFTSNIFSNPFSPPDGSFANPFSSLQGQPFATAINQACPGGALVAINAASPPSTWNVAITISKPMSIISIGNGSSIGK